MIVAKFGSSSLQNIKHFQTIKQQILTPQHQMVVVSALGGHFFGKKITDVLIDINQATDYLKKQQLIEKFLNYHREVMNQLNCRLETKACLEKIQPQLLEGNYHQCLAVGEYLSARILADYWGYHFVDAYELIYFQDANTVDLKRSVAAIQTIHQRFNNCIIPGFYGNFHDNIHLFSRGGSDITAAVVAYALTADIYENWKDTDGIYYQQSNQFNYYNYLSYYQYYELIEQGYRVIHKEAIDIAAQKQIPIRVCNVNTLSPGTIIDKGERNYVQS